MTDGKCLCNHQDGTLYDQSLSEMEFQRGIWQAAVDNDIPKTKKLLLKGLSVNSLDSSGYTALHYAARNKHLELVKLLIENGACVNCVTKAGHDSPLHRAAYVGHLEITKILIAHGAHTELQNNDGQTCLHKAVLNNHYDIVKYLTSVNPNLKSIKDFKAKTPLSYNVDGAFSNFLT